MANQIHPLAVVDPEAKLGDNNIIGPFCVIDKNVVIGDNNKLYNSVTLHFGTRLGNNNEIFPGASISTKPQDLKFQGEETTCEIGDNNSIRENVTISRGTASKGKTTVGNGNLLMENMHIGHDCEIGNGCIIGNSTKFAGEVIVDDNAIISACCLFHQFLHIGGYIMFQGGSRTSQDIPPYVIAGKEPIRYAGVNLVGLRRRGFPRETIEAIHEAYRIIYSQGVLKDGVAMAREQFPESKEVAYICDFIENSKRGTLIVITGPTAVGKTALCMDLATHFGIPIINADSRQIYRELKIGTARPTEAQMRQTKHYFVGTLGLEDYYSASLFEQQVLELLSQLFQTHDYALLTGGSMMYIDAVCDGIDDIPTIDDETRALMKQRLAEEGLERLCEDLKRLDPEYYEIVDKQNPRRVVHALEICTMTGQTYTSFRRREKRERPFRIIKIGLNRPREELYTRINQRVDEMMASGLLDEVKAMYPKRSLNALNTVGYKELFDYLDGRWSLEEAVERIKGNTRRYARKQLTWYKKDEQIRWFHPDEITTIIDYIISCLLYLSGRSRYEFPMALRKVAFDDYHQEQAPQYGLRDLQCRRCDDR